MVSLSFVTHTSILKMFSRFVFVLLVCGAGAAGRSPEPPSTSPGSLTSGTPDIQTLTMDEKFDRIASVLERTTSELKLIKEQQNKAEETKFLAQYAAGLRSDSSLRLDTRILLPITSPRTTALQISEQASQNSTMTETDWINAGLTTDLKNYAPWPKRDRRK